MTAPEQEKGNDNLKTQARLLSAAYARYGPEHPEVVRHLRLYAGALRDAGRSLEAAKYEQAADDLDQALKERCIADAELVGGGEQSTGEAAADADAGWEQALRVTVDEREESPAAELHLFDSAGRHVATMCDKFIYTPEGRNIGRWNDELAVFIARTGDYLGSLYDGNRLVRDNLWPYHEINFGDRGNGGDRPGWGRQPDIEAAVLPDRFQEARV